MNTFAKPKLTDQEPHQFFTDLLGNIEAEKVLDVACGPGGFTGVLKESLKDYSQIIGTDISEDALRQAREYYSDETICFDQQDAAALSYSDSEFDLVGCAFSLHHLPEPQQAMTEIRRVLKPGGYLLIVEMYRDHLTKIQQTESLIHHWAAEIDTALGISHNQTFTRQQIIEIIHPEQYTDARIFDLVDFSFDPLGKEITDQVTNTIERVLKKAESLPNFSHFQQQAERLRQRVLRIGTHISTRLVFLAKK